VGIRKTFVYRSLAHDNFNINFRVCRTVHIEVDFSDIVLYGNGVQHTSEPLAMDCFSPFGATRAYETPFSSTGVHHDTALT